MTQQLHEDHPLLDQIEILNIFYEDGQELLLNISLEEVLAADVVFETAVIGDEIGRVSGS